MPIGCLVVRKSISYGTFCSGSDLVVALHASFSEKVSQITGLNIKFDHVFSIENCPKKRQWIRHFFPSVKHLFTDVAEFSGDAIFDDITQSYVKKTDLAAVGLHFLVGGFSCKDASPLKARAAFASWAVEMEETKHASTTSNTFSGARDILLSLKPLWGMFENVSGPLAA